MRFNLSEWALHNRQLVLYFMILMAVVGFVSYGKLGQSEDPPFTFKVMVIQTYWPGASAQEVALQVTDRIEKKLMETGEYDKIIAYSRPGESMITFMAPDDAEHRKFVMGARFDALKRYSRLVVRRAQKSGRYQAHATCGRAGALF